MSSEGRKDDAGKLRYDLVSAYGLEKLVEVYTIGATKYSDRNWEKGIQWGRVFAAMMRHAWKWWNGEEVDQVDGQHHLASVAWCAFALLEYTKTHKELDDRPNTKASLKAGDIVELSDSAGTVWALGGKLPDVGIKGIDAGGYGPIKGGTDTPQRPDSPLDSMYPEWRKHA